MANQKIFQVTVTKVDGPLLNGEALSVTVPGVEGEMTILPEHTALISPLKQGVITVHTSNGEEFFDIERGTLEVSGNQATVLL